MQGPKGPVLFFPEVNTLQRQLLFSAEKYFNILILKIFQGSALGSTGRRPLHCRVCRGVGSFALKTKFKYRDF